MLRYHLRRQSVAIGAALHELRPHAITTPNASFSDRFARRFVVAVWTACLILLMTFVARTATRIPYVDEYFNAHLLLNPFQSFGVYWQQHNEHRIPLPRMLFVAAVKLTGNDFRATPFLNALILSCISAILVGAVARRRGWVAWTDAFLPLLIMNVGQYDNLMWGFQVQFISSSALALLLLAVAIHPLFAESSRRLAIAGLITLLVPLCGANGVALAPAFSCLLLFVAARNLRSGSPSLRRPGAVALFFGLAALTMVPIYFHGLQPCGHHEMSKAWDVVAVNAVNFLGIGFGGVAFLAHGLEATGFSAYGLGMLALLLPTAAHLAANARKADWRATAVANACTIVGILSLGLGLAYGRGGMGSVLSCNRYATLAMPLAVAVYVAWAILPSSRWTRVIPAILFLVAAAGILPNARQAFAIGAIHRAELARTEYEIRSGIPLTFVVDRHHLPADREVYAGAYKTLRDMGAIPFRDLVLDSPMDETPIALRVGDSEGMESIDGFYRVMGDKGHVVLTLPRRQYVYGFKLVYEANRPTVGALLDLVSWESGGTYPPRAGYGMIGNLYPTTESAAAAHIFVDRETDCLRIDLGAAGAAIRPLQLSILTRRD